MITFLKRSVFATIAFAVMGAIPAQATAFSMNVEPAPTGLYIVISTENAGEKAQKFIDDMGTRAISFLGNNKLSAKQKQAEFKNLLENSFDMRTIGRFAMGRHWRTASKQQQAEYQKLFNNMIVNVYSGRFSEYKGQGFEVSSYRADGKKDFLVRSNIVPNNGSKIKVDWRVRHKDGKFKVIDIIIEGVSMSLTQRSDFSSVIQRNGGKVEALLEHLRK